MSHRNLKKSKCKCGQCESWHTQIKYVVSGWLQRGMNMFKETMWQILTKNLGIQNIMYLKFVSFWLRNPLQKLTIHLMIFNYFQNWKIPWKDKDLLTSQTSSNTWLHYWKFQECFQQWHHCLFCFYRCYS